MINLFSAKDYGMTSETPSSGFETLYQAAVENAGISTVSRGTANKVIDRLLEAKVDTRALDLTKRIQAAAGAGDTDQIFKLTDELRDTKNTERERAGRLAKLAEDFSFIDVLNAFSSEYKDLIYELGMLVIQQTEEGLGNLKKRTKTGKIRNQRLPIYVISRHGKSIEISKNPGPPRYPSVEREFYEFMDFKINPDGRSVEPPTFVNVRGETVKAAKKALIDDLMSGGRAWKMQGYSISEKPSPPPES